MVWGMLIPKGFGEFWPDGDFEYDPKEKDTGWYNRLEQHYREQTPEEQIRLYDYRDPVLGEVNHYVGYGASKYPTYVSGKFKREAGSKDGPDSLPFGRAEAHEAPSTFDTEKTYEKLGSLIALNYGILAVDEILKEIIERLEPGMHQFFPIEIKMPKGTVFPKKYYTLVIGQYCDSFSPGQSDRESYISYPNYPGFYNLEESKKGVSGLALSKIHMAGSHLWRERAFRENLTCFSDELISEISRSELRIPKHYKMKEV
jgi:hypothetical protein